MSVNGEQILPSDKFKNSDWEKTWQIDESVSEEKPEWAVSGRIMAARRALFNLRGFPSSASSCSIRVLKC